MSALVAGETVLERGLHWPPAEGGRIAAGDGLQISLHPAFPYLYVRLEVIVSWESHFDVNSFCLVG